MGHADNPVRADAAARTPATPLQSSDGAPLSLTEYWMPFTPNRDFKSDPKMVVRAEGMYYWNDRGEKIIDGASGLFCVAAGHGRREIAEAVSAQMRELDYVAPFTRGHPRQFELATRLAAITPGDLNRIFFANSGSEAVETAMKIALAYHQARGQGGRTMFVSRERAYHGVNFGGVSLAGLVNNRRRFGPSLPGIAHMRHTHLPENRKTRGEPVHGILLIVDEVITGFGRTGKAFAADSFGVVPDIMTMAKALTNAAMPMGAVAASTRIHDAIMDAAPEGAIEFFHGYTYSGHPAACAAGLATLDIYRNDGLFERGAALSPYFQDAIFSLADHPAVADVRGYGMMTGIDFHAAGAPGARGHAFQKKLFDNGMHLKATGDCVIVAPPLIAEKAHIDVMTDILRKTLSQV